MVKQLCYLSVLLLISCSSYKRLHQRSYLVDTHNDILNACVNQGVSFDQDLRGRTHSDLNRFIEGGVDLQVFSVWSDGDKKNPYAYANQQIDTLLATISRNRNKISLVNNSTELQKERSNKKLSAMIGLEGGHMMENNLDHLDALYTRGVRYMTLTWNNSTSWATSAMDETTKKDLPFKGLTSFGKDVVKRMNQLGMIVDVSHVGERTFWDAIETTTKPVIASHSCVHSICPVFRNLKDDQIKAIAKNGGVIHLNFYSGFVDPAYSERIAAFNVAHKNEIDSLKKLNWPNYRIEEEMLVRYPGEAANLRPPLSMLMDHLDHIVRLTSVDHVGIGSDFDGISSTPQGLNDVTSFPLITKALLDRGYSKKDIRKILGENFLRILVANERK